MRVTIKPGDELFVARTPEKRKSLAHVGIREGHFLVIHAPFEVQPAVPFNYGIGFANMPLTPDNVGQKFRINYPGLYDEPMFTVDAIDQDAGVLTITLEPGLTVLPRDDADHALDPFDAH
jgi:hypothetical protein